MKTRILTRDDVKKAASMEIAVAAVERAFAAHGRGEAVMPPKVYLTLPDHEGDFRAMPARLDSAVGVKWVNSHPKNPERHGLPTVMGTYILSDPATALPLAVMDATLLTALRTGAAAGVASKYLAHAPKSVGFIGCGVQAHHLLDAHRVVFEHFDIVAADANADAAKRFADEVGGTAGSLEEASGCDIVCTATPTQRPVVQSSWVRDGTHINAMGADAPGKQELDPAILTRALVYIDELHQAEGSGEINVPVSKGTYSVESLAGTLGEVIAGKKSPPDRGRLTVFDSTGLAIQDVALAQAVYEAARERGLGPELDLCGVAR